MTKVARFASLLAPCALCACLGQTHVPVAVSREPHASVPAPVELVRSERTASGVRLETTHGILDLASVGADTFRLRLARRTGSRRLPSFAVRDDPALASATSIEESEAMLMVRTERALLRVDKKPLRIRLMNEQGRVLSEPALRFEWTESGLRLDFGLGPGERVFGLGDKVRGFDRRGQRFELWNTDAYGWKTDTDPLYKSLPVWLVLGAGRARGVFVDSPTRATVDVGAQRSDTVRYEAERTDAVDVYLFGGPEPKQVLGAYAELTGPTPLPPLWSLGHHQSRYGYLTEAEVRSVVARMQAARIPLDAVWLDIDFQNENAPFTVNEKAFPRFAGMVKDFADRGVRTVAITDLHVKSYQGKPSAGYAPYDTGAAGDHFVRSGGGFFEGKVWPGASVFPEFTREKTRAWWGELYRGFASQGVAGFWNDMNEPAVFERNKTFPDDVRHRLEDGTQVSHVNIHNAYGSLNAQATYEGLLALRPDVRPFVLTRAAYSGVQRYAASWTGDNTADRAHLAVTIPQLLNLGVSGYPFNGADVGGFVGCPDAELFAEWMELGAWQPFYRNHSAKDACRREPWLFGDAVTARVRKAVERRYALLPYLYTAFEATSRTGLPVMRPLWLDYPNDAAIYDVHNAFLLGEDLLVAAKLVAGPARYRVVLPAADWYDTQTLELVPGGPRDIQAAADEGVRVFARAGAIIPEAPPTQSTKQAPDGPLLITVWPGARCHGTLYADDGATFGYRQGALLRVAYSCSQGDDHVTFDAKASGSFVPWWRDQRVVIHDVPRAPRSVRGGEGKSHPHRYDAKTKTVVVDVSNAETSHSFEVRW